MTTAMFAGNFGTNARQTALPFTSHRVRGRCLSIKASAEPQLQASTRRHAMLAGFAAALVVMSGFSTTPVLGQSTPPPFPALCNSDDVTPCIDIERTLGKLQNVSTIQLEYSVAGPVLMTQPAYAEQACSDLTKASNGIEWCDTKEGGGKEPTKGQLIRCHYTGRLASNGKVFDSSYGRRPLTFKVGNREVIQGWDKGILGEADLPAMKEGGKRRVKIPPSLAYGERGAGKIIPPNSTLIFDVELLGKK